ncbi:LOW QUALITY PROTEIN: hypothetical protein ACHAWU_008020 [Discostella pseudostelligera]|uniref:Uncharacterized protein n=1 Tax=Discostella pseudostelligera TaxID=259834 RepID=A0ABD3M8Z0_9STRA
MNCKSYSWNEVAQRSLHESERSTDRVNSHLLDYSVTSGVQYKLSQAKLDRLDQTMDEFISSLPEDNHRREYLEMMLITCLDQIRLMIILIPALVEPVQKST